MSRCMSDGRSLYRINDKDPSHGCLPVNNFIEADHWNFQEWGIFWTVNRFNGPRRKENCTEVISWAVDLDSGSKEDQLNIIRRCPIIPSCVNETARGHHVYFDAIDGDPENYWDIVERLVDFYSGDKNAKDLCRILRVPAYLHWKGEKPFAIKWVHLADTLYTENEMREAFPKKEAEEKIGNQKRDLKFAVKHITGDGLWERIWNMDCEDALLRISGSEAVNGEIFSFKKSANGNLNILVNCKGTSCWIDKEKRIGSSDRGGPTIYQWINWYQKNSRKTVEYILRFFPEVAT